MNITLKYGCPECPPADVETGEYTEHEVWVVDPETTLQGLLRRIRREPEPGHSETRRTPKTRKVYQERPLELTFTSDKHKHAPYLCPLCRTQFNYVECFVYPDGETTKWQWSHTYRPNDTYVKMYSVDNCKNCGGRFCRYSLSSKGVDRASCRACAAGAFDSDVSGQHGLSWGSRE